MTTYSSRCELCGPWTTHPFGWLEHESHEGTCHYLRVAERHRRYARVCSRRRGRKPLSKRDLIERDIVWATWRNEHNHNAQAWWAHMRATNPTGVGRPQSTRRMRAMLLAGHPARAAKLAGGQ